MCCVFVSFSFYIGEYEAPKPVDSVVVWQYDSVINGFGLILDTPVLDNLWQLSDDIWFLSLTW